jgi:hypothetical protein
MMSITRMNMGTKQRIIIDPRKSFDRRDHAKRVGDGQKNDKPQNLIENTNL